MKINFCYKYKINWLKIIYEYLINFFDFIAKYKSFRILNILIIYLVIVVKQMLMIYLIFSLGNN